MILAAAPGKGKGLTQRRKAGGTVAPRVAPRSETGENPASESWSNGSGEARLSQSAVHGSAPSLEDLPARIEEARSRVLAGKGTDYPEESGIPNIDPRRDLSEAEVREVGEVLRGYVDERMSEPRQRYEAARARHDEAGPALERQREAMQERAEALYGPVEAEYPEGEKEALPEVPEPGTVTIAEYNAAQDDREAAEGRNASIDKAREDAERRAARAREQQNFRYRREYPEEEAREDALVREAVASTNERAAALESLKEARREATLEAVSAAHGGRMGSPDGREAHRWAEGSNKESRRYVEEAAAEFPSSWVAGSRARGGIKAGASDGRRSWYKAGGPGVYRGEPPSTMLLAGGFGKARPGSPTARRKAEAATHESCHRFEDSTPHLKRLQARFLDRRAEGKPKVKIGSNDKLGGSTTDERARDGGFFKEYCGKEYPEGNREILSEGYTAMLHGDERFERAEDKDYEDFVYGAMSL